MNYIKQASKILCIVLFILLIISLIMGGLMILFSFIFGILMGYYGLIFLATKLIGTKSNQAYTFGLALLFFIPLIWSVIDPESIFNFMTQGFHIDMRH